MTAALTTQQIGTALDGAGAFRYSDYVGLTGGWELGAPDGSAVLEVFPYNGTIVVQVVATPCDDQPDALYTGVALNVSELPAVLAEAHKAVHVSR